MGHGAKKVGHLDQPLQIQCLCSEQFWKPKPPEKMFHSQVVIFRGLFGHFSQQAPESPESQLQNGEFERVLNGKPRKRITKGRNSSEKYLQEDKDKNDNILSTMTFGWVHRVWSCGLHLKEHELPARAIALKISSHHVVMVSPSFCQQ